MPGDAQPETLAPFLRERSSVSSRSGLRAQQLHRSTDALPAEWRVAGKLAQIEARETSENRDLQA